MAILAIFQKDFNLLKNARLSSLILLFGPILLIIIMGIVLQDTSIKNIKAGIYSEQENEFTKSFTERLRIEGYIVYVEKDLDQCKESVIDGISHVCIEITKTKEFDIMPQRTSRIVEPTLTNNSIDNYDLTLYVDFSKQRIVWKIIGSIQWLVEQESQKTRQIMIGDLKKKSNSVSEEAKEKLIEIDYIITKLEYTKSQINNVEKSKQNWDLQLDEVNKKLEDLGIQINSLEQNVPVEQQSEVRKVGSELQIAKNSIASLDYEISQNGNALDYANKEMEITLENLKTTKNSLSELIDNLEDVQEKDAEDFGEPIKLQYKSVSNEQGGQIEEELEFFDYLFPSFIIFFIMFVSLITSTLNVQKERSSRAYIRNISSKINGANFVIGTFIISFLITAIQIIIILLISSNFLNISLTNNLLSLSVILIFAISIFTLMGISIAYIFNSMESAITASIILSILFFVFSSIITPVETLSQQFSKITSLLPLTLFETKIRLALIFGSPLQLFPNEVLALLGISLSFILITISFYKKNKEKEI